MRDLTAWIGIQDYAHWAWRGEAVLRRGWPRPSIGAAEVAVGGNQRAAKRGERTEVAAKGNQIVAVTPHLGGVTHDS